MLRNIPVPVVDVMIIKVENLTKPINLTSGEIHSGKPFTVSLSANQICGSLKRNLLHYGKGRTGWLSWPQRCGQSTTLKILTGILFPTGGKLILWVILPGRTEKNMWPILVPCLAKNHSFCGTYHPLMLFIWTKQYIPFPIKSLKKFGQYGRAP